MGNIKISKIRINLSMKKFLLFLILVVIPVFAYEVYSPENYKYESAGDKLLFVIDFSNSMTAYLNNQTKTNQVKELMATILPQISPDTKVGLRVYGHTCNFLAYNACRSSELIVPLGLNNSVQISSELHRLRPKGMTPITYSLKQAVKKDLNGYEGIKHIILLTDGGENCDESPCDFAIALMKQRRDIKIDVIAFDVEGEEDLAQLKCTADVTGGRFSEADTKAELFRTMEDMILPHRKEVEAVILK